MEEVATQIISLGTLGARENAQRFQIKSRGRKNASGRTTPEPHFRAKRQFRFLVKPVFAAKLRLLTTGRNEAHHLQTFLKIAIRVTAIHFGVTENV